MSMDKIINKEEIKKIFNSYALKHGYSEPPPSIIEFISNDYYLGKSFNNGKTIYKYWLETLVKMFPTPFPELNKIRNNAFTDNYIIVNTSAIATGKCHSFSQEIEVYMSEEDIKELGLEEYIVELIKKITKKIKMKKIKIPIKKLFDALKIKHEENEYNDTVGQTHFIDKNIFVKTSFGKLTKINALVTKKSDTYEYFLENGNSIKCSNKHIIIENGKEKLIDNANSIDNIDGKSYKIIKKEKIGENEIVYDFNIDYPHLYITPDGSIHHNTFLANIIFLYDLAHILCLENPQAFYKLAHNTKIDFLISNSTKENSETINYALILGIIRNSPFFLSKLNNKTKTSMFEKNIDLLPISPYRRQLTGRAVFSVLMDELNRHPQPRQALAYVTEAINRLPSRFLSENKGQKYVPGHLLIISSADTDASLIEQIKFSLTGEENESTIKNPLLLINAKQFEVLKEKINFSDKYFYVFTGTYNLEPKILEGDDLEYYKNKYPDKIEKVPYDYYLSFKQNLRQAIGDILGIPVINASSFITDKSVIAQAFKHKNPTTSIIEYDNDVPLINYFNLDIFKELLNNYKGKQFVLGLDLAYSNDKLGIALGCIKKLENSHRHVDVIFATALTPVSGQKIKFSRIRKFILDLKEKFNIHIEKIYADTFQSYDFITLMQDLGFDAKQYSVDRKKDPYYAFKNALYENLIDLPENSLLEKELIFLKEDEKKIDHPDAFPDGTPGSKDTADAVCQVYSAILDLEYNEFYEKNYLKELEDQLDIEIVKSEMRVEENDFYNLLKGKIENINDYI